jgi:hypothetical protein
LARRLIRKIIIIQAFNRQVAKFQKGAKVFEKNLLVNIKNKKLGVLETFLGDLAVKIYAKKLQKTYRFCAQGETNELEPEH